MLLILMTSVVSGYLRSVGYPLGTNLKLPSERELIVISWTEKHAQTAKE